MVGEVDQISFFDRRRFACLISVTEQNMTTRIILFRATSQPMLSFLLWCALISYVLPPTGEQLLSVKHNISFISLHCSTPPRTCMDSERVLGPPRLLLGGDCGCSAGHGGVRIRGWERDGHVRPLSADHATAVFLSYHILSYPIISCHIILKLILNQELWPLAT